MPELPEVETIKRDLEKQVLNKEIVDIKINLPRSFENTHNLQVKGKINQVSRIGKYIIMQICPQVIAKNKAIPSNQQQLIIHLRMTGKLIYHEASTGFDERHARVILLFKEGDCLIFNDVRTFGKIEVHSFDTDIADIKNLGVDALSDKFTFESCVDVCRNKKIPIKNLLLDQRLIAGIGNIYAQEILFAAKISPLKLANTLTVCEVKQIYTHTKNILELAIKHNGTSISDFRRVDDKTGEFQNFLKVYGKKSCCICGDDLVKIKQGGRSTTYCENCQTLQLVLR